MALSFPNPAFEEWLKPIKTLESSGIWGELNARYTGFERTLFGAETDAYLFGSGPDPRVASWPLMRPVLPIAIVLFYLTTVPTLAWISKKYFSRQDGPLATLWYTLHNGVIFFGSLYMAVGALLTVTELWGASTLPETVIFGASGKQVDRFDEDRTMGWSSDLQLRLARLGYLHFLLKILEMGDTYVIVAKQNWKQLSFLHVYHHASVLFPTWYFNTLYVPGGESWFCVFLNSTVHVFMYGYYFFCQVGLLDKKTTGKGFARYLTVFQITQFVLYLSQCHYLIVRHSDVYNPKIGVWQLAIQAAIFLVLFVNFFMHKYLGGSQESKELKKKEN